MSLVFTGRSCMLRDELRRFPSVLTELLLLKEDAYTLALSSKPYDLLWTNRGKKPPARSQVERIVVNFLASTQITQMEDFTRAVQLLLDDCAPDEREVLLSFWRTGETVLPEPLLYRYSYFRGQVGLPDDFLATHNQQS
jgi:hypothetical protein